MTVGSRSTRSVGGPASTRHGMLARVRRTPQNNAKLLDELGGTDDDARTARFRCAIALVDESGRQLATAEGACQGRIGRKLRGTHGFGYDPLFVPDGYTQTMAELGPETKNNISHRAQAAAKLVLLLRELQNR